MGVYEDFIYVRSYSRWLPELQRRETWEETVRRYCYFIFSETLNCSNIPDKTKTKIFNFIMDMSVMPSMRLLWSAGENAKRDNIAAYNCAAMAVHAIECFGEMMYILLAGAGCGFSVEDIYVSRLPFIKKQKNREPIHFSIPDTKLGWKQAVDTGMEIWYEGRDIIFDYSQIRPAGTPLVISGGYASGPAALQRCLEFLRSVMIGAQERQLEPIEVSDSMNEIGNSVVCGGVRRSSEICLTDVDDVAMRDSKQGNFHPRRFMANISSVYRKRPNVLDFTQEFINMAKAGSGERGIFNLAAARKRSPKRRDKSLIILTNPCFTYENELLTEHGYIPIGDLCNQEIGIVNKDSNITQGKVWCSGKKEVVNISFYSDSNIPIRCTPDHIFMLNDGSVCKAEHLVGKRLMPFVDVKDSFESEEFLAGFNFSSKVLPEMEVLPGECITPSFISGLFSANGYVIKKYRVVLKSIGFNLLIQIRSLLKKWFNIDSYITTNKATPVDFRDGTYLCKESYDLNIGKYESLRLFAQHISFGYACIRDELKELLIIRSPAVAHVVPDGEEFVYDFVEPETHWGVIAGCVVHNCAETLLRDMECCNLTEVVVRPDDDFDDVVEKIKTATWLGVIQSTLTYFPHLRPEWKKNAEEERLLGVSLTGLCDNMTLITPETLRHWKRTAVKTADKASKLLGINMPAAVTLGKPSGCRPWDSITSTTKGLLTLEELFIDHPQGEAWAPFSQDIRVIQENGNEANITKTFYNGLADIINIRMNYGLEVRSTRNHKWFVKSKYLNNNKYIEINEWKRADEIELNDILDISVDAYANNSSYRFKDFNSLSVKMRGDCDTISQPEEMNEDIAWFLGYLWGDGTMSPSKYRVRFIDGYLDNLEKVKRIVKKEFNLDASIKKPAGQERNASYIDITSKMLWHWLLRNDVWKYFLDKIDIIPRCIRASTKNDILAFFAGFLDADGWSDVTSDGIGKATISTTSKVFAKHLQSVGWAVGVTLGNSLNNAGQNLQKRKEIYLMPFNDGCDTNSLKVVLRNSTKLTRVSSSPLFIQWTWESKAINKYNMGKVINIEMGEQEDTYDIEIDGEPWYYNGAVKSHNTVSQRVDCSSGMHSRWAKYYIRRVRISTHDSLFKTMVAQGMPFEMDEGNHDTAIFSFPIKSPVGAKLRSDDTALGQLEWYRMLVENWCEQNMSCFSGDTKVFTKEGLLPFSSLKEGAAVEVLNSEGRWVPAVVREYGEQEIYEIYISSGKKSRVIKTTKDHLWPINYKGQQHAGGSMQIYRTEELPIGQQLVQVFPNTVRHMKQLLKHWCIQEVKATGVIEKVYCVEEPINQHFVIDGNILTHNCTIFVKDEEWLDVTNYVYKHFDTINGVAFFPYDNKKYKQPPYEEIDELTYKRLNNAMPNIDFSKLCEFEKKDETEGARTLACSGGACEL